MNKAPAFQFYASDFLIGVMGLSDEEIGVYIKMLAFQWERGYLPNDRKAIKKLINSDRIPSENVLQKFSLQDDGVLRNERLEKERSKQSAFRESRAENARRRWAKESTSNARASGSICKKDALLSSSSDSIIIPKGISTPTVSKSKATIEELQNLAIELGMPKSDGEFMFDHWESNGWRNGSNPVKDWKAGFRKWKAQSYLPSQKNQNGKKTEFSSNDFRL